MMKAKLETINEIFDEFDTNKDGELDFEEAKKFLMNAVYSEDDGEPVET